MVARAPMTSITAALSRRELSTAPALLLPPAEIAGRDCDPKLRAPPFAARALCWHPGKIAMFPLVWDIPLSRIPYPFIPPVSRYPVSLIPLSRIPYPVFRIPRIPYSATF